MEKTVAIYPGRFQPFGPHHYEVYKLLANKFGAEDTYIATSDKTDPERSPFTFEEKKQIAISYGIPADKIIQTKSPYQPKTILDLYQEDTPAIFLLGEKDAARLQTGKIKKDGTPGYFAEYDPNTKELEGWPERGYVIIAPNISKNIPGVGEMSGTNIRKAVKSGVPMKDIFGDLDVRTLDMIQKKFQPIEEAKDPFGLIEFVKEIAKEDMNEMYIDKEGNLIGEADFVVLEGGLRGGIFVDRDKINVDNFIHVKAKIDPFHEKTIGRKIYRQVLEVYKKSALKTYNDKINFTPEYDYDQGDGGWEMSGYDISLSEGVEINGLLDASAYYPDTGFDEYIKGMRGTFGVEDERSDAEKEIEKTKDMSKRFGDLSAEDLEDKITNLTMTLIPKIGLGGDAINQIDSPLINKNIDNFKDEHPHYTKQDLLKDLNEIGMFLLSENSKSSEVDLKETDYTIYIIKYLSKYTGAYSDGSGTYTTYYNEPTIILAKDNETWQDVLEKTNPGKASDSNILDTYFMIFGAEFKVVNRGTQSTIEMEPLKQKVLKYKNVSIPRTIYNKLKKEPIQNPQGNEWDWGWYKPYSEVFPELLKPIPKPSEKPDLNEAVGDKTLYAFDLDDTLITTKSYVRVTNPEKGTFKLTPAEYALYKPGPDDELNFDDFASLNEPKVIPKMFNLFSQILTKTSKLPNAKTVILTARQPEVITDVDKFLSDKGLADIQVHAVGSSDPMEKVKVILDYIENGYKRIRFYDDSPKNVRAIKSLNKTTDADVKSQLVSLDTMLKEFSGGATMNKQEMGRHKKKLAKLKKYMANQGDQMIPYPDLPKTVIGGIKLYESISEEDKKHWAFNYDIYAALEEALKRSISSYSEMIIAFRKVIPRDSFKLESLNYFVNYIDGRRGLNEELDEGFLDKMKEFGKKVKEVGAREGKETGHLLKLLWKIIVKRYQPTDKEKQFMKGQSLDLGRMTILTAIQLLPIPGTTAITTALIVLGKKYGFNVLPSKQGIDETKLFSKKWWKEMLMEGGAAGHMAHPFDIPDVTSGKDLINVFEKAAKSLEKAPGSVKIDGVNASVRFNGNEFVMDRGSKKELDIKGITKRDLEARFGQGHGMIKSGGETLDILNRAIPEIKPELQKIGMLDNPNIMFNMEYVGGKTNVQDYDKNFLAIHSVMNMETKEVEGKRGKMLTKRIASEVPVDKAVLDSLLDKLNKAAKEDNFEVYGDVETELKRKPNFGAALSKRYTVVDGDQKTTKSLREWLDEVKDIPKDKFITLNGKKLGAVSKAVYMYVLDEDDVSMFDDKKAAVDGAITYLATEKLGDEILKVLDSPMGSVENHEGVVIRDPNIYNGPFKITGKFILGGMATSFTR